MAEKQGFEPWEGINPQRFSRPPLSTTQPPLLKTGYITTSIFNIQPNMYFFRTITKEEVMKPTIKI